MNILFYKHLEWDSKQLGISCGRITSNGILEESDSAKLLDDFKGLIHDNRAVDLITIKLPSTFRHVMEGLIKSHARFIDTELTFKLNNRSNLKVLCDVDIVEKCNAEPFIPLATGFNYSRLFLDPRIPKIKAEELWANSIRNHCLGKADQLAIAYSGGLPAGLTTINYLDPKRINLHIVGVLKEFQRRGIGRSLLSKIIENYGGKFDIFVEASSMNTNAIKLYQNSGFVVDTIQYVLHVWPVNIFES
jgi:ribosomal protein S18 acetylase RimI-like enzyme